LLRDRLAPLGPGEERTMTTVVSYRVLLREGEDATEYTLERTQFGDRGGYLAATQNKVLPEGLAEKFGA